MRWSIRYQLLIPILILLLGVVGISTWTGIASAQRATREIEDQVRDVGRTLAESPFPLTPGVVGQLRGITRAEYLVVENNGDCLATSLADPRRLPAGGREPSLPAGTRVRLGAETFRLEEARQLPAIPLTDDYRQLRLGARAQVGDQTFLCSAVRLQQAPNAGAKLYILYPEARWREAVWNAVLPSVVLGVFGGVAAIVLAGLLGHRLARRIGELERRTRQIAAGDFSPMPLPRRHDELRDLSRSINEMAQQLAQMQETMQKTERLRVLGQVSGGLAHQLRNGVTGARLAVQLHARACANSSEAEALDVALRQLALVEANLRRFLDLGKTDGLQRAPCSLKGLLDETVALLRPQSRHQHTDLRWQPSADQDSPVLGDASQLGQLFLNVIGNALEAAGPGGWVELRERVEGQKAVVEVIDSGVGPPEAIAGRLFEPFVTGKSEGVGLGLAVAKQAAEAHGGRINWRREEGTTCFRIELPVSGR